MNTKELIKNKGLGYWICAGAAVVALIMAIVVFATWDNVLPNRVTDGYVIGIVFLIAFVVQAVVTFFPIRFAAVVSVGIYGITFGVILLRIAEAIADYFNKVAYQGGNFVACVLYAVICLVLILGSVAACFFSQTKDEKYLI